MQPQQQLFGKIAGPLGDPGDMTGAGQHRHRAHQQDRRQLMADPLRCAVIRDCAQLQVGTGLCFDHDLVDLDHVRLPVVVGPERRMVETGGEDTGGVGPQRGEPAALRLAVVDSAPVAPGVARRLADLDEVRCPIARAGMTGRVGERLDQQDRMAVDGLDVAAQPAHTAGQDRRGKVRASTRGQDTEPLVVHHVPQPAVLRPLGPADERLPCAERQCCGAVADERDPLAIFERDMTDQPAAETMTQEVMLVEQIVEPVDLTRTHQAHRKGPCVLDGVSSHPPLLIPPTADVGHTHEVPAQRGSQRTLSYSVALPALR